MVTLARYESTQLCVGIVNCLRLLWEEAFHR